MSLGLFEALVFVGFCIGTLPVVGVTWGAGKRHESPKPRLVWYCYAVPIFVLLFNAWALRTYVGSILIEAVTLLKGESVQGPLRDLPIWFWDEPFVFILAIMMTLSTAAVVFAAIASGEIFLFSWKIFQRLKRISTHDGQYLEVLH